MIVDTSALLAVAFAEPDAPRYAAAIVDASPRPRMSAGNLLEAVIVVESRGDAIAAGRLDAFIRESALEILPFTAAHVAHARRAWRDFGKGRHPAQLNFGDCIAYATAKEADAPLLFKGSIFAHTDIAPALKD
jgi:ribonuclease VapC